MITSHRIARLTLCVLGALLMGPRTLAQSTVRPQFFVHAFGGTSNVGKCLDYQPEATGSAVFLNDCGLAHPVDVREIPNERHEVRLWAGNKVIGVRPPAGVTIEASLELQEPFGLGQRFSLDGDSIILASNRALVAKVQNARGTNGTPIVLGARQLADAEFWDFRAIGGYGEDPHSGFVRVSTMDELRDRLDANGCDGDCATHRADYGTVIRVMDSMVFPATLGPLQIPAGVTLRGDRQLTLMGPEIWMPFSSSGHVMMEVAGDDTRITGLRITGPNTNRNIQDPEHDNRGIVVLEDRFAGTIIDHNDIGLWDHQAVAVRGDDQNFNDFEDQSCGTPSSTPPRLRPYKTRVARNFIHHNLPQNKGYGVNSNSGAFPFIEGNVFVSNRHAIAETNSTPRTGYRAWYNLVLWDAPTQYFAITHTHDFDVHGTGDNGFGGRAGGYNDIFSNTFFGTNRDNFEIRGDNCEYVEFRNNISLQSRNDTVNISDGLPGPVLIHPDVRIARQPHQFNQPDPTEVFGIGDFDGDGNQDLFMATGTAWYYSSSGVADWRFLSAKREHLDDLRFGDFDGDHRTDVLGKNGEALEASWGGASEWERVNGIDAPMRQLAVGDFDGNGRADIFYADGDTWHVAFNGGSFEETQTSSKRVADLRFGDFDGDGTTDVMGVVSGAWQVSYSARSSWTALRSRLTNTVNHLFVADFDGNGRADLATLVTQPLPGGNVRFRWRFSRDGVSGWTDLVTTTFFPAAIGRFAEDTRSALLLWDDNFLREARFNSPGIPRHSRQDMR